MARVVQSGNFDVSCFPGHESAKCQHKAFVSVNKREPHVWVWRTAVDVIWHVLCVRGGVVFLQKGEPNWVLRESASAFSLIKLVSYEIARKIAWYAADEAKIWWYYARLSGIMVLLFNILIVKHRCIAEKLEMLFFSYILLPGTLNYSLTSRKRTPSGPEKVSE